MTTWIERTARQKAVSTVVLFCVVTAIVVWIYAANGAYVKVFFNRPPAATAAELDAAQNADSSNQPIATPYVTITGDKVLNTGVQEVTTYEGVIKNVSAGYYALQVGDRVLIVKSAKTPSTTVSGALGSMPYDLKTNLFPPGTDAAEEAAFYPLLLDTNYRESGYVGAFWTLLVECCSGSSPGRRGGGSQGFSLADTPLRRFWLCIPSCVRHQPFSLSQRWPYFAASRWLGQVEQSWEP